METDNRFKNAAQNIAQQEVCIIRDIHRFPVYNKDMTLPHLALVLDYNGTARAIYDTHEVQFTPNDLAVVLPNHLLRPIDSSEDYNALLMLISHGFVQEMKQHTLTHDYMKYHSAPFCRLTDEQVQELTTFINALEIISRKNTDEMPHRHAVLLYLVDALFELINSFRRDQDMTHWQPRERAVFNTFCDLLAIHHRQIHSVADYAAMLHLSPKYFSSVIQKVIGVTAGDWIDEYLITQIKKTLTTRDTMTVQQVAFDFGFDEAASFCRFFKRKTGMTPTQYRKKT